MKFKDIINNFLVYDTVKIVTIRDKRLALIHYGFIVLILMYIIGVTIVMDMKYLKLSAPVGNVRTSLESPEVFTPASEIPYCAQNQPSINGFSNDECYFWDEHFVEYPAAERGAITLTTRVKMENQTADCDLRQSTCRFTDVAPPIEMYIGDIERFSIKLDHSFFAPAVDIERNAVELPGKLIDVNGRTVLDFSVGKKDEITIQDFLTAANVDLDSASFNSPNKSQRHSGVVIIVFIEYSNTVTYNLDDIQYTISCKIISNTQFKSEEPIYTKKIGSRVINDRHGVRLVFMQIGELGAFDFQVLLISFVAGMGLLAASTFVVDLIATYVMKEKSFYENYKYEKTKDVEELRELMRDAREIVDRDRRASASSQNYEGSSIGSSLLP